MDRPSKRVKVSDADSNRPASNRGRAGLSSLHRSISPPRKSSPLQSHPPTLESLDQLEVKNDTGDRNGLNQRVSRPRLIPSPFRLTHIRDLPDRRGHNHDTVKLRDILGDPMIRECWQFNYLFDVDFMMAHFDEDVRGLVKVKVVHGSWKKEAENRIRVDVSLNAIYSLMGSI